MATRNLIDLNQLSLEELDDITDMACRISKHPTHYSSACRDKLMAPRCRSSRQCFDWAARSSALTTPVPHR